jgi:Domain of unknown function (DUF4167)
MILGIFVNQRPDHMRNNNNRNRNNNNNRNRNNNTNNNRGGGGGGGQRTNGIIDARARGNAQQLLEKYKNMGRDAAQNGDRVLAEYYMQFADHYFRVVSEYRARFDEQRTQEQRANGTYDENDTSAQDDVIEGVGSENLAQTGSFGGSVPSQTFGADAAPGASIEVGQVSDDSAPQEAEAASDDSDAPRSRNRRGRSRSRRPEGESAETSATSEAASETSEG